VAGSVTLTIIGPVLQAGVDQIPPDATVTHGLPVVFDGGRSTGPKPILLFEWWANWNPASPTSPDLTGPFQIRPTFTYANSGTATVRLQVTYSTGATSAYTYGIVIQ
jgi:hypothetical protein